MESFNNTELYSANTVINKGLQSAAQSLSFFIKDSVIAKPIEISNLNIEEKKELNLKCNDKVYLLTTEIIGELQGVCCLIFCEEEAHYLQKTALPDEITSNSEAFEAMRNPILLEIDNIITAAVVTQFSNLLHRKMHGSVPTLQIVNQAKLDEFIEEQISNGSYIINFKTNFVSSNNSFSPIFVWFMDALFHDDIKKYTNSSYPIK